MYKIELPNFEGPYDLMLYFIKRDELNIYDIPISKITNEFLNYIRLMHFFDLELAGEFILTSASLMRIKSKMLLPINEKENNEDNEDPRTELVQKLLEYKQIKEVTNELANIAENNKYYYYKQLFEVQNTTITDNLPYKNANLFDLLNAFNNVINRNKKIKPEHFVESVSKTVEERIIEIENEINLKNKISFYEFLKEETKEIIVLTFLAILDMTKQQKITIAQDDNFDDILILKYINFN